jgi:hypothetical protein
VHSGIHWWVVALDIFHRFAPFPMDVPLPSRDCTTDTCLVGAGGYFRGDWFHVNCLSDLPSVVNENINVLEFYCVKLAAERWGTV